MLAYTITGNWLKKLKTFWYSIIQEPLLIHKWWEWDIEKITRNLKSFYLWRRFQCPRVQSNARAALGRIALTFAVITALLSLKSSPKLRKDPIILMKLPCLKPEDYDCKPQHLYIWEFSQVLRCVLQTEGDAARSLPIRACALGRRHQGQLHD